MASLTHCVGYHWFEYRDEPKQSSGSSPGGFGAENSNYGLVQIDGTPWPLLTKRMTDENGAVEAIHAKSRARTKQGGLNDVQRTLARRALAGKVVVSLAITLPRPKSRRVFSKTWKGS